MSRDYCPSEVKQPSGKLLINVPLKMPIRADSDWFLEFYNRVSGFEMRGDISFKCAESVS
jgi:hypothetical protein